MEPVMARKTKLTNPKPAKATVNAAVNAAVIDFDAACKMAPSPDGPKTVWDIAMVFDVGSGKRLPLIVTGADHARMGVVCSSIVEVLGVPSLKRIVGVPCRVDVVSAENGDAEVHTLRSFLGEIEFGIMSMVNAWAQADKAARGATDKEVDKVVDEMLKTPPVGKRVTRRSYAK